MKVIRNKTPEPIKVPLGAGKFLHLGPRKSGEVADGAPETGALARLIAAGTVEVVGDAAGTGEFAGTDGDAPREFAHGHTHATKVFPSGNRGG